MERFIRMFLINPGSSQASPKGYAGHARFAQDDMREKHQDDMKKFINKNSKNCLMKESS